MGEARDVEAMPKFDRTIGPVNVATIISPSAANVTRVNNQDQEGLELATDIVPIKPDRRCFI